MEDIGVLEFNLAEARFEINTLPFTIEVLERWEVPPVSEANKKLERLEREIKKQNEALDELR